MNDAIVAQMIHDCMLVILKLGGPILCSGLFAGLIISFIQAVTQINEATLAFLPKLGAIGLVLMLLGPYMVGTLSSFSIRLFDQIVAIGGS